jgi:hypothetical protein
MDVRKCSLFAIDATYAICEHTSKAVEENMAAPPIQKTACKPNGQHLKEKSILRATWHGLVWV